MKRAGDDRTIGLFLVPEAEHDAAGMDYRGAVSRRVSRILRATDADRHHIAAECSRLTGRDISKPMLDAYASEARDTFNIPFWLIPALEIACETLEISNWLAGIRGGRLLVGRDALAGELARLERARCQTTQKINSLRKIMEVTA